MDTKNHMRKLLKNKKTTEINCPTCNDKAIVKTKNGIECTNCWVELQLWKKKDEKKKLGKLIKKPNGRYTREFKTLEDFEGTLEKLQPGQKISIMR